MGIIILCVVIAILLLLLLAPISVRVRYAEDFLFQVKFCGIPLLVGKGKKKKKKTAPSEPINDGKEDTKEKSEEKEKDSFLKKLSDLKDNLNLIIQLLKSFLKYSRKRIVFKKLDASLEYGTEDAAKTAITVGVLWSALYGVLPVLDKVFMVKNHQFSVHPIYNQPHFSARVDGIIRTRLVHIIFIASVLGIKWMKYKKTKKKV